MTLATDLYPYGILAHPAGEGVDVVTTGDAPPLHVCPHGGGLLVTYTPPTDDERAELLLELWQTDLNVTAPAGGRVEIWASSPEMAARAVLAVRRVVSP